MLALVVVALVGAVAPGKALGARTVRVGAEANGTRITIRRGDRLLVSLAANPSTGYTWKAAFVDRTVLRARGWSYRHGWRRLPGAGGTQTLAFRAIWRGVTQLSLAYAQARAGHVAKSFRLTRVRQRLTAPGTRIRWSICKESGPAVG